MSQNGLVAGLQQEGWTLDAQGITQPRVAELDLPRLLAESLVRFAFALGDDVAAAVYCESVQAFAFVGG